MSWPHRILWFIIASTIGWTVRHGLSNFFENRPAPRFLEPSNTFINRPQNSGNTSFIATRILDGDTLSAVDSNGVSTRFRLAYIDAPELHQDYGEICKEGLSRLILNKQITVQTIGSDRYGRTIAVIFCDGIEINLWMVSLGYAWSYPQFTPQSRVGQYRREQDEAFHSHKGLWLDPCPEPPWEWRAKHARG